MGNKPIIEKSNREQIPSDGRLSLGDEYAHRRVPLEINVPAEDLDGEPHDGYCFYTVDKFEADSRGRVTIPAPIREQHNEVFWVVSEAAYEHGGLAEAYEHHDPEPEVNDAE